MKNIERGTVKYLLILICAVGVCGMILYPLFDLVYYKLITNSGFTYSINKHIIQPVLFSIIFSTTFWLCSKKRNK